MAFQGFAREEQFSTNQITIDINSVIDNDLAEANRQSKIRTRNSEMADKWGTMYLNAMINKHEVEKRNREENFKFFMDNREAIQKQEQYNWDVKKKDAERSHPYVKDLGAILGPALFKMAVTLGSDAIKKYGAAQKAERVEAEEQKHKEAVGNWKNVLNQSNPEQLKILDGIDNFHGMVAEEQKRIEDEWRAAGDIDTGDIKSAQFASAMGMTSYLRETIAFSPDKVAIQYQNYSRNFETEINGRLYNQNDIIAGVNQATLNVYNARKQEGFGQSEGINLAERHGEAAGNIVDAMVQEDARYSKQSHNSSVRNARDERHELFTSNVERMQSQGRSMNDIYQHTFNRDDPTSPSYRMSMTETGALWQSWADNGMFNAADLGKHWRNNKVHGGRSLAEQHSQGNGTRASRAWKAAMDKVDLQNMQEIQNSEAKHNALAKQTTNQALNGEIDQKTARNTLEFFGGPQGKAILAKTSTTTSKNLISALSNAAGLTAQPQVVSDGWLHADKEYNKTTLEDTASQLITTADGKHLALSAYPSNKLGLTNTRINHATKMWIAEVTDHLITTQNYKPKDPILKEKVLAIADDPQNRFTQRLAWQLTAETGPPGGGPEDMYEVPRFPNLTKPDGQGTTSITAEYRSLKADKKGPAHWKDLKKIYNLPGYRDWVEQVNDTIPLGGKHLQNVLSNPPPEVQAIITDQKHGSAWQAYMNALKYGGEDYADFKPLSEGDGLDFNETSQLNAQWGAQYANLSNSTKKHINTQGFTLAPHVRREGTLQPQDHFEHGTQGIKTPQGVFANREIAGYATSIAKAYPNMTWTSTQRTREYQEHIRRTQGVNPSDTSNHLKGISFDAAGNDAQRLKQDIDSGVVQGVSYYIEPGYTHVHFDITGPVSINGVQQEQQTQLPPMTVPMNISGVGLGEPTHRSITDTVGWLADLNNTEQGIGYANDMKSRGNQ
jgi:hypothetical protein